MGSKKENKNSSKTVDEKTKREDQSKMGNISPKNTLKKGKKCAIILNKPENLDVKILRRRKREYGMRIFAGT